MSPTYAGSGVETDEGDDLGYYPDGVKRTLTDQQISMFRHSEIYSLIRKRQLLKENREVDEEPSDLPVATEIPFENRICPPEEAAAGHIGSEHGHGTVKADHSAENSRENDRLGKRRKHNAEMTSRRQARELDDAVANDNILDYGEDTGIDQSKKDTAGSNGRSMVSYADDETPINSQTNQKTRPPKKGRKIWWPTIGVPEKATSEEHLEAV